MTEDTSDPVSDHASDVVQLRELNGRFIAACRLGSWEDLKPVLSDRFAYVDGSTGERWETARYIEDLRANPIPNLTIDQVDIHVAGDTAGVSARTTGGTGRFNRYLDVYAREADGWRCVQASVWPLRPESGHAVS
ncbi:DUF4440 domain-containing protein [Nocardioides speluncae]|uniref:DUF4440 domain-containing protein n=1 Tax=Nocardioides speluncae TaxID=2670337 RepID=UPI000D688FA3|nr:DUF4440 domain-containing protein [Nocardioides speluncae]